jgi:hypothetical protein
VHGRGEVAVGVALVGVDELARLAERSGLVLVEDFGSGFYIVGVFGTALGLVTLVGLRVIERRVVRPRAAALLSDESDRDIQPPRG